MFCRKQKLFSKQLTKLIIDSVLYTEIVLADSFKHTRRT